MGVIPGIGNESGAVFANFETDIYDALEVALAHFRKYHILSQKAVNSFVGGL